MAFFNYATMQMAAKIVYYGPGLCGKTTNLQYIYNKTAPRSRGEMVSLETEADRTLFFDLLPLEVGVIAGFRTRFQLYTVPGQVFYGETRRMVLKGVDGVVFVADSQAPVLEANVESLKDLELNLQEMGLTFDQVPIVMQYNKRDLANVLPLETLQKSLNAKGWPQFEASALNGMGVFDTLKGISKLTLHQLTSKLGRPNEPQVHVVDVGAAQKPAQQAVPSPAAAPAAPTPPPPAAALPEVEFATQQTRQSDTELAQTAPKVRTVNTAPGRVSQELDRIRESLLGPMLTPTRPKVKDLSPAIEDLKRISASLLPPDQVAEVQLPAELLRQLEWVEVTLKASGGKAPWSPRSPIRVQTAKMTRSGEGWIVKLLLTPKKS